MLFFSGFARTFSFFWELGINLAEFSSIIYILKEDFYITSILLLYYFSGIRPCGGFCCFARLLAAAVRPPLALVGDGHPDSHVTDANAG